LARPVLAWAFAGALLAAAPEALAEESAWQALDRHLGRQVSVELGGPASPRALVGRLRGVSEHEVVLRRRGRDLGLERARVRRIELLPRGRVRRMLVGALLWGTAAYVLYDPDARDDDTSRAGQVGLGMLAGGAVGALLDWSRAPRAELLFEAAPPPEAPR
jgi:hypothetical protein